MQIPCRAEGFLVFFVWYRIDVIVFLTSYFISPSGISGIKEHVEIAAGTYIHQIIKAGAEHTSSIFFILQFC